MHKDRMLNPLLRDLVRNLVLGNEKRLQEITDDLAKINDPVLLEEIIEFTRKNDLSYKLYKVLKSTGHEESRLGGKLSHYVQDVVERASFRDKLLVETVRVFEENNISYVVFKTFNTIGSVDVDIDVLIKPEDYWRCIRALLRKNFIPIDDLSKTYATGFMMKKNPIVLDLHTELTILGAPYLSKEVLFNNPISITIESPEEAIDIYVTNPIAEAVARIAHAIVKEAEIKLDDMVEVHRSLEKHSYEISRTMVKEALEPALQAYIMRTYTAIESIPPIHPIPRTTINGITPILAGSPTSGLPPLSLSRILSIATLLNRLAKLGQAKYILTMLHSLRYRRNAAHIGHLALKLVARE